MTEYLIHSNAKQDKKLQGLYSGIDFCFSISNWKFNDNSINFVKFWIQGIAGQIPLPHKNLKIGCCRIHIRWYCCSILTKMSDGYKILSEIELQKNERTDWIPSTATLSKQSLFRSVSQTLSERDFSLLHSLLHPHQSYIQKVQVTVFFFLTPSDYIWQENLQFRRSLACSFVSSRVNRSYLFNK